MPTLTHAPFSPFSAEKKHHGLPVLSQRPGAEIQQAPPPKEETPRSHPLSTVFDKTPDLGILKKPSKVGAS